MLRVLWQRNRVGKCFILAWRLLALLFLLLFAYDLVMPLSTTRFDLSNLYRLLDQWLGWVVVRGGDSRLQKEKTKPIAQIETGHGHPQLLFLVTVQCWRSRLRSEGNRESMRQ